ncbi:MAG: PepSY domain-containing protein [Maritimibacter sp.]|nr:PepSY domain-containing protein [Maritimibacter sp.]
MRKLLMTAALVLVTAPAFATGDASDLAVGTQLGTTEDAIKTALTDMGWEVRKLDTEDGMIEAYAVMGDMMAEIYVDPTTGAVVKLSDED